MEPAARSDYSFVIPRGRPDQAECRRKVVAVAFRWRQAARSEKWNQVLGLGQVVVCQIRLKVVRKAVVKAKPRGKPPSILPVEADYMVIPRVLQIERNDGG